MFVYVRGRARSFMSKIHILLNDANIENGYNWERGKTEIDNSWTNSTTSIQKKKWNEMRRSKNSHCGWTKCVCVCIHVCMCKYVCVCQFEFFFALSIFNLIFFLFFLLFLRERVYTFLTQEAEQNILLYKYRIYTMCILYILYLVLSLAI